jgi:hypothetical protein
MVTADTATGTVMIHLLGSRRVFQVRKMINHHVGDSWCVNATVLSGSLNGFCLSNEISLLAIDLY